MEKKKQRELTLAEKVRVLEMLEGTKMSQLEIARRVGVSQPAISRLIRKKAAILEEWQRNSNPDRKRRRVGKDADVDAALLHWFEMARAQNVFITGEILMAKARTLADALNVEFTPTSGWLSRWKNRNNICVQRAHSESVGASQPIASSWIHTTLLSVLQDFRPEDIFNCDETSIYYRAVPVGSLLFKHESLTRSKKTKDQLTVLFCCNMTGTEKTKLLLVGKCRNPRCFQGISPSSIPVTYTSDHSAWMTATIFVEWLKDFDQEMKRQRRNVALLLDKCSAHPSNVTLQNVKVFFLPSNVMSLIQPLNWGIIRNFKALYRRRMIQKIINVIDEKVQATATVIRKTISLLDAVHMMSRAWEEVRQATIEYCFHKTLFCQQSKEFVQMAVEKVVPPDRMTDEEFYLYVDHDSDVACIREITATEICSVVKGSKKQDGGEEEEEEDTPSVPRLKDAMRACAIIERVLAMTGADPGILRKFYDVEHEVERALDLRLNQCQSV
ncbi:tigger transposable element-derived protein 3-like [Heptranchias perlo]|uniref:tigger transposable element-derived protein 3-like n=1 Tax=Heptranchias perlo TaxID=212740 RepID=UPI00355944CE